MRAAAQRQRDKTRGKSMIIDAHVHFFPDKIAARAVDKLVQVRARGPREA